MALFRIEARLNYTTGLPADIAVNTFYMDDSAGSGALVDAFTAVQSFYNDIPASGTHAQCYYLSALIDRGAAKCEMFAYEVGTEGPPVHYSTWTLGAQFGTGLLPPEVALCLSYAGSTPGVVSARQRGRVFMGPLGNTCTGTDGKPTPTLVSDLSKAGNDLADELFAADWVWVVYSRVNGLGYGITHGWVDNEFDTQRRRQVPATSRTTFTV